MNELIKIIKTDNIDTVNARELHGFLESKQHFTDWMKSRIDDFSFIQGVDFIDHKNMTQYNQIDSVDYFLTVDMAKELSMVERNDKGKEARQYFIKMENIAKQAGFKKPETLASVASEAKTICDIFGFKNNQMILSVDQYVKRKTGESPLELMGQTHLLADSQDRILTPTEIGKKLGSSGMKINLLLKKAGLQNKDGKLWAMTKNGKEYGILFDTGKKSGGVPVQQLKWNSAVIAIIEELA